MRTKTSTGYEITAGLADYERSCRGKVRYVSKGFAKLMAKRMPATAHCTLRAYACRYCHGYHLGNRSVRETT